MAAFSEISEKHSSGRRFGLISRLARKAEAGDVHTTKDECFVVKSPDSFFISL